MIGQSQLKIPQDNLIAATFNLSGTTNGGLVVNMAETMHQRCNGFGAGFACYGIYDDFKDCCAVNVLVADKLAKTQLDAFFKQHFTLHEHHAVPTRKKSSALNNLTLLRYFVSPLNCDINLDQLNSINGAYLVSYGKNFGVFKGIGYPSDVAEHFMLDSLNGSCFVSQGVFAGQSPDMQSLSLFGINGLTVAFNGAVTSYLPNKYACQLNGNNLFTSQDAELVTCLADSLINKQGLSLQQTAEILSPLLWQDIDNMQPARRNALRQQKHKYSDYAINGMFSMLVCTQNSIMASVDRLSRGSLTYTQQHNTIYIATECCALPQNQPTKTVNGEQSVIFERQGS